MKRRVRLFEGRSKIVYEGPKPQTNILFFKDDVSNLSAANREVLDGRGCLLYTSPSPRDQRGSRMPSSA